MRPAYEAPHAEKDLSMFKFAGFTLAALTLSAAAHADIGLKLGSTEPVSYTHLTLPTSDLV